MKTLVNTLLIALTLVSSAATFSTAKPIVRPVKQAAAYEVGIYTAVDGNLRLALDKQKGGRVTICIKNAQGRKLITEYTGKGETKARYNFNVNELPDGIYSVEISNGVQTTTHELTINTPKVETLSRQIALN